MSYVHVGQDMRCLPHERGIAREGGSSRLVFVAAGGHAVAGLKR
jgi:hypothetical protein